MCWREVDNELERGRRVEEEGWEKIFKRGNGRLCEGVNERVCESRWEGV